MAVDGKYGEVDIDRISDPDEPIFILRAQDIFSSYPLRVYRDLMVSIGNREGAESTELAIKRFETWNYRRVPS